MTRPFDSRGVWARFLLARRTLDAVTLVFGRHGIDALAVKGIVTSEWLYGDHGDRPLSDIDVRIRPRDFGPVLRASRIAGWRTDRQLWSYRSAVFDVDGLAVDVESHVGPPGLCALSVDAMLQRATRDPGGFWVPEIHDHAVLLTVNVFKDKMTLAMPWALNDVERMVTAPGFREDTYVERAREGRVATVAWLVADWMARERASDAWGRIRGQLGGDTPMRASYTNQVRDLWARNRPLGLALRLLTRAGCDDAASRIAAIARSAACEVESRWDVRRRSTQRG